jgi:hypothetical protein
MVRRASSVNRRFTCGPLEVNACATAFFLGRSEALYHVWTCPGRRGGVEELLRTLPVVAEITLGLGGYKNIDEIWWR